LVLEDGTNPEFILEMITGDEMWVYSYKQEIEQQPQSLPGDTALTKHCPCGRRGFECPKEAGG
jgi:hypothetical protein